MLLKLASELKDHLIHRRIISRAYSYPPNKVPYSNITTFREESQQMILAEGGGKDQKLKCDYGSRHMIISEVDRWKKGKERLQCRRLAPERNDHVVV